MNGVQAAVAEDCIALVHVAPDMPTRLLARACDWPCSPVGELHGLPRRTPNGERRCGPLLTP